MTEIRTSAGRPEVERVGAGGRVQRCEGEITVFGVRARAGCKRTDESRYESIPAVETRVSIA
jgi:hypothetical protein